MFRFKRILSLLLVLSMVCALVPVSADAKEIIPGYVSIPTVVNPAYADVISVEQVSKPGTYATMAVDDIVYYTDVEDAAQVLREGMKDRQGTIVVGFETSSNTDFQSLFFEIWDAARVHTGNPTEGDYLDKHWSYLSGGADVFTSGNRVKYAISFRVSYYTTAAQEAEMDEAVEDLLEELDLEGKDDYETFLAVYDWICNHIEYDYTNLYDESYTLKFSAYAALVDRAAVCQGYATLLYRLLLELGIDCRVISGMGNGGRHAWNIVEMDGKYYNVDATWDTTYAQAGLNYNYLLRSQANFVNHVRDEEFDTSEFHAAYPMGTVDYTQAHHHTRVTDVGYAATCTQNGLSDGSHCAECGEILEAQIVIPALGHAYRDHVTAPTCTQMGYTTYTCTRCGDISIGDYTNALGHNFGMWETLTAATCTEDGLQGRSCETCDHQEERTVTATGHIPGEAVVENVTFASCEESGTYDLVYYCTACSQELSRETIFSDVNGHAVGSSVIENNVPATCTQDGSYDEVVYCGVCCEELSRETIVIRATGHYFVLDWGCDATCTEAGNAEYVCCYCWDPQVAFSQTLPATGHSYKDGVCTECGHVDMEAPAVTASNVASSGKIKLSWDTVIGAVEYKVYRATSKNGTYKLMKTTTSTSWTHTGAVAGKTYYYYVVAVSGTGVKSDRSSKVSRTCDLAQPTVTLSNVASSGKIKVSWDKVDGAVEYKVYRATSKNGTYDLVKTTTSTSYTNTSAVAGKTYYYKVVAVAEKSAANSAYSAIKYRTCDLARPTVTLSNVASSGKVKVSWDKVNGAVEYKVYRATSKNGTYKLVKTTTSSSYTDSSAVAGKTYYYKVVAVAEKSAANSAYSSVKSRTCDLARPDVSITRSNGKPKLTWKAVDGAVEYKIYRATSKNGEYKLIKTTSKTSFVNTGATAGRTYYYKVVAVASNSTANSAYSTVVFIKAK